MGAALVRRCVALLALLTPQCPQLRGEPQHQRAVEILGILFTGARRRAAARQQLTPDNLTNEWGSVIDQQIAKPRARVFVICRVEERQHQRILSERRTDTDMRK